MLNRTKRARQKRCTELALAAQRLASTGHGDEAVARYAAAADIARRLAEADPDDPRPLRVHAGMLFSLAGLHSQEGQLREELAALRECADAYRDLAGRGFAELRPELAAAEARKSIVQLGLGLGASAVLDADTAVTLYRELFAENGADLLALGLAAALIYNAEALTLYGDPDLAAASADHAMQLCLPRQQAPDFPLARLKAWEQEQAGTADMTLAQALAAAAQMLGRERVPEDLAAALTKPVTDGSPLVPSDRCDPRLATGYASRLADVAVTLLPNAPAEALRIGLEAHYLFVSGSRLPAPEPGQLIAGLISWARLLLDLCRFLATTKDDPARSFGLALNLVHYHLRVVEQLMPLVQGPPPPTTSTPPGGNGRSLGELLRDCLAQDAELVARNNDHEVAHGLRKMAASIER